MNYRHHFHAGNFADVVKHALLVALVRSLQRKDKGFLYLDTHAGRGRYDLEREASGESLARKPEWPDGIGRLWRRSGGVPAALGEYLQVVEEFDRTAGNLVDEPRFYPGSPRIVQRLARPQDRLVLCEKHSAECAALRAEFRREPGISVRELDGYAALRAMLPPPERRGLVLIDPPFEAQDEFAQIGAGLAEALRRFPSGVFAVWYPLTGRAKVDEFFAVVRNLNPPPALACEVQIAGAETDLKLKGCGVLVLNPPWQFETVAASILDYVSSTLAQEAGAASSLSWLVREA
jgi:23S rRNA (adenine2030-N6)-methyltransferase